MEIVQIAGIGLIAAVLAVTIRQNKPEIALAVSISAGLLIFFQVLGKIGSVIDVFKQLFDRTGLQTIYLATLLKIIAIAYIAEFGAQICRDAGEGALAVKIEFAAKILVLVLAVPILAAVLQVLLRLVP
ncbi:MAG: stage III sporulation protein AD [Desulfotomaculales bacterium]|jgi:stage III sporulation protein AD